MKKINAKDKYFFILKTIVAIFVGIIYLYTAIHLDLHSKSIPDELIRRMIPFFIVEKGYLPNGFELELNAANGYGFSYASYPPFPALLSSFFIKSVSLFTDNSEYLIIASRLGSVLFGIILSIYLMKLGRSIFNSSAIAAAITVLVCLTPQVIFICGYYNADSISLGITAMIMYCLIEGSKNKWKVITCIKLALAMSICILTYYNAYPWCLMAVCYCLISSIKDKDLNKKEKSKLICSRTVLIAVIILVCTSWYFVRNAYLYHGDFLAINIKNEIALITEKAGYEVHKCNPYLSTGKNVINMLISSWSKQTLQSLIGVFGAMDIYLPNIIYWGYVVILIFGLLSAVIFHKNKDDNELFYILIKIFICTGVL